MKPMTLQKQIDRLGVLKAEIADREAEYKTIVDNLKESGIEQAEGKLFKLQVCTYERTTVDYKGLVEKLKVSARVLRSFTTATTVTMAKVLPR